MWAAAQEHADVVRTLIANGADVKLASTAGFTPLIFATRTGHREIVDVLLDAGAPIDTAAPDGSSALIVAIVNAHYELAAHLLARGADVSSSRLGWTPLHTAVRVRNPDTVAMPNPIGRGNVDSLAFIETMLEYGADPNAVTTRAVPGIFTFLNTKGATPFLLAAQAVDVPLMQLLLDWGTPRPQTFDTFVVGKNAELLALLTGISQQKNSTLGHQMITVWGPSGSGKSHGIMA